MQTYEDVPQYTFTSNGYTQPYSEVSSYSTVTTTGKSPRKTKGDKTPAPVAYTTRPNIRARGRNSKDKFMALVKKLYRISNALEDEKDITKLTASVINVIMEAKPMVPEEKASVLFEEEPRALVYPRRIRAYKKVRVCNHLETWNSTCPYIFLRFFFS